MNEKKKIFKIIPVLIMSLCQISCGNNTESSENIKSNEDYPIVLDTFYYYLKLSLP